MFGFTEQGAGQEWPKAHAQSRPALQGGFFRYFPELVYSCEQRAKWLLADIWRLPRGSNTPLFAAGYLILILNFYQLCWLYELGSCISAAFLLLKIPSFYCLCYANTFPLSIFCSVPFLASPLSQWNCPHILYSLLYAFYRLLVWFNRHRFFFGR